MSFYHKSLVGVAILAVAVLFLINNNKSNPIGSVTMGNEYRATTTLNYAGVQIPDLSVLKVGSGALGSVVITGANTGTFVLYDATSTVTNTEWPTTTLAVFPTNAAAGTYTFDVEFKKGLLIDWVTNVASSTITFR